MYFCIILYHPMKRQRQCLLRVHVLVKTDRKKVVQVCACLIKKWLYSVLFEKILNTKFVVDFLVKFSFQVSLFNMKLQSTTNYTGFNRMLSLK